MNINPYIPILLLLYFILVYNTQLCSTSSELTIILFNILQQYNYLPMTNTYLLLYNQYYNITIFNNTVPYTGQYTYITSINDSNNTTTIYNAVVKSSITHSVLCAKTIQIKPHNNKHIYNINMLCQQENERHYSDDAHNTTELDTIRYHQDRVVEQYIQPIMSIVLTHTVLPGTAVILLYIISSAMYQYYKLHKQRQQTVERVIKPVPVKVTAATIRMLSHYNTVAQLGSITPQRNRKSLLRLEEQHYNVNDALNQMCEINNTERCVLIRLQQDEDNVEVAG